MSRFTAGRRFRMGLSLAVIGLAFTVTALNTAPAQAQLFHEFTVKLDLNPLPFTDSLGNAYWHGPSKYTHSNDPWISTLTLNVADKHPDPTTGIITLDAIEFKAQHVKTGDIHGPVSGMSGWVNTKNNTLWFQRIFRDGDGNIIRTFTINGFVQSWWTVQGVRKGPNVIQSVLSIE